MKNYSLLTQVKPLKYVHPIQIIKDLPQITKNNEMLFFFQRII